MPASEVPTCISCGYSLAGLERGHDRRVVCPECGLRQMPGIRKRRHSIGQFLLWCCLAPFCLCSCCALMLALRGEDEALYFAATGALLAGFLAPPVYASRLACTRSDVRYGMFLGLMFAGWVANFVMGMCFMSWAAERMSF